MHVANGGTSTLAAPVVSITVPAQTAFVSVTNPACSLAAGVVTCNLPDLAAGGTVDFDLVVSVSGAATGTITLGDYSISGTGYPALLGPARTTVVNAPVAVSDSYTTTQNTALVVAAPGVLVNDTDPNGDALTAVLATNPAHGTLTLNATEASPTRRPASYTGPDSFIYRARDASNNLSTATNVALSVTLPGTPVAVADAYSTNEDTPLTVSAAGVLANDTDVDADPLTAVLVTGPAHGTLTLNADGSFLYTPAANYHGTDSFTYRANDGTLSSSDRRRHPDDRRRERSPAAPVTVATTPTRTDEDTAADGAGTGRPRQRHRRRRRPADRGPGHRPGARHADAEPRTARSPTRRPPTTTARTASPTRPTTAPADSSTRDGDAHRQRGQRRADGDPTTTATRTDEDTALTVAAPGVLANDTRRRRRHADRGPGQPARRTAR